MPPYTTQEINARFELLGHHERRCIIRFLQETEDGHAELGDIVSYLTKQDPTPSDPKHIEILLHHNHLPKLASIGVLEFDSRSETVRYHGDDLIEDLLEMTPETCVSEP